MIDISFISFLQILLVKINDISNKEKSFHSLYFQAFPQNLSIQDQYEKEKNTVTIDLPNRFYTILKIQDI